ncbi:MAG: hypothetical protein PVS3B3_38390 [Ktedonobacteraceae bacterium]
MIPIYRLLIFSTIAAMVLLVGCGQPSTTSGGTPGSTPISTPSVKATTAPTRTPTYTRTTGPVTLRLDKLSYQLNDTISIDMNNQSNQIIYFPDHLTNCSVILLLRLSVQPLTSDSGQVGINPCRIAIATRIHSLAAGQNLVVRLIAPVNGWSPGFYLATLSYSTSLKRLRAIYTRAFSVGSTAPQP